MSVWKDELTCKPLDTYSEVLLFLQNPPSWRTLCIDLQPHSKYKVKNLDLTKRANASCSRVNLVDQGPETFCHFDPDAEDVERHDGKLLPKTLVCHDMANGYHDDSIIDGTGNYDAYTFYNWAGIDIFCYFSHHLITIPPLSWINIGHKHGVKVIGTVITEWADGIQFWDQVLHSEEQYKTFASQLVAIAKTLKFDGWLLNIENKISKPEALLAFVRHLHQTLHRALAAPVLLWYDSVTVAGHLTWQNELNAKNKPFFDACDGLFTNYTWTAKNVEDSAVLAGDRLTDLFVGIDVWGRNFYGGGQFNVHQAIHIPSTQGCSLAIFAPAWTHEAMTTDKKDPNTVALADSLDKYNHFLLRDRALWDSFWRYLNTSLPCQLPFKTSFCRGQGKKRRLYGEVLCPVPWFNLRHMQYQPNSSHGPHGYILSSQKNIFRLSQHFLKFEEKPEPNEISKYEAADLIEPVERGKESGLGRVVSATDMLKFAKDKTTITEQQAQEEKPLTFKTKIKNVFKHILKQSTRRSEELSPNITDTTIVDESSRETKNIEKTVPNNIIVSKDQEKAVENVKLSAAVEQNKGKNIELSKNITSDDEKDVGSETGSQHKTQFCEVDNEISDNDDDTQTSTGLSLVQMSVNLQLGRSEKFRYRLASVPQELQCLEVYFEDSFTGGSCLKMNPSDSISSEHRFIRIFHTDFFIEDSLIVCVVTKTLFGSEEQFLNLKLFVRSASDQCCVFSLIGRNIPAHQAAAPLKAECIVNLYPLSHTSSVFKVMQKYLLLNEPGFYVPVENSYNWAVRYYLVSAPGARVTSVNCRTGLDQGPILLGHLGVCRMPPNGAAD